jgi:hypothetical protein
MVSAREFVMVELRAALRPPCACLDGACRGDCAAPDAVE